MKKERRKLKRLIYVLFGIAIILGGIIFIIYKNNYNKNDDVVDIFKEDTEEDKVIEKDIEKDIEVVSKVIVDIKGMVVNPGIYEVDSTARVNDVISLAGGLLEGADTSMINLAKIVHDEMTIIVYSNLEVLEKFKEDNCVCEKCEVVNDACIDNVTEVDNDSDDVININTADIVELQKIDGIGEAKAKAIIEYRTTNGLFKSIEDIKKVTGIGESLFEKIKIFITV